MECNNCKSHNDEGARFCRICGAPLIVSSQKDDETEREDRDIDTEIPADSDESEVNKPKKKRSKTPLIIIAVFAIFAGIIIFMVFKEPTSYYESSSSQDSTYCPVEYTPEEYVSAYEEAAVAEAAEEPSLDELYDRAESIHDLRVLADNGYLKASFDLVKIFYRDGRYEECSEYACRCLNAGYQVYEVQNIVDNLPAEYMPIEGDDGTFF